MPSPLLCLMTEASQRWGMGHLVRSLAIAQTWRTMGGEAVFCISESFAPAEKMIRAEGFDLLRAVEARRMSALGDLHPDAIVVDFPRAGYDTCRALIQTGYVVAHIDDLGPSPNDSSHIILNPNLYATWPGADPSHLLGPRYALLRPRFAELHEGVPSAIRTTDLHLLIIFGGTDAAGLTPLALRAARGIETVARVTVVLSENAPTYAEVSSMSRRLSGVRLVSDEPNLADLMASGDLAIGAAGTTIMELACLGVPQLVCPVVDGQRKNAHAWAEAGALRALPNPSRLSIEVMRNAIAEMIADSPLRGKMSERGRQLVDGKGTDLLCRRILQIIQ